MPLLDRQSEVGQELVPQCSGNAELRGEFLVGRRGGPADEDESALLLRACDACADDPEADLLLSAGGSG